MYSNLYITDLYYLPFSCSIYTTPSSSLRYLFLLLIIYCCFDCFYFTCTSSYLASNACENLSPSLSLFSLASSVINIFPHSLSYLLLPFPYLSIYLDNPKFLFAVSYFFIYLLCIIFQVHLALFSFKHLQK